MRRHLYKQAPERARVRFTRLAFGWLLLGVLAFFTVGWVFALVVLAVVGSAGGGAA